MNIANVLIADFIILQGSEQNMSCHLNVLFALPERERERDRDLMRPPSLISQVGLPQVASEPCVSPPTMWPIQEHGVIRNPYCSAGWPFCPFKARLPLDTSGSDVAAWFLAHSQ